MIQYRRLWSRWAWLIILCPLLAAVGAAVGSKLVPPTYEAQVDLLVKPAQPLSSYDPNVSALTSDQISRTYAQLITEPPLLNQVISDLDLKTTADALSRQITVVPQPNTTILRVTVQDTNPQGAQGIANLLVADLIAQTQLIQQEQTQQYTAQIRSQIQALEAQIAKEQAALEAINANAGGRPLTPAQQAEQANLIQQLALDRAYNSELIRNLASIEAESARSSDNLKVVAPASLPAIPVAPRVLLNIAIAFAAGLLAALALALLLEFLDQSIKGDEDLTLRTGLVPLGHIANTPVQRARLPQLPALIADSAIGEAYRTVRTNLLFTTLERKAQVIVVTSALPSEGKSRTAANVAVVLAQAGHRTLILDGDFRRPSLDWIFGHPQHRGLSNLMLGDPSNEGIVVPVEEVPNLWLITAGPQPPNPSELLGSSRMRDILEELRPSFRYILVDTPPLNAVTDAAVVASLADAVLMVVEQGRTTHAAVNHAKHSLERGKAVILGAVLNKCRIAATSYPYEYLRVTSTKRHSNGRHTRGAAALTVAPSASDGGSVRPPEIDQGGLEALGRGGR